jgi:hypothetical protein
MNTFMTDQYSWLCWDLDISPHAMRRMPIRGFSETDLRGMLEDPDHVEPDACPGRFVAHCRWHGQQWNIILEPDKDAGVIIVVTAFSPGAT